MGGCCDRRCRSSISDYDASIALNPNESPAFNNRGYAYKLKGDIDRALPDYDRAIALGPHCAIAIEPRQPQLYVNRGVIYLRKIRLIRAAADFYRAFKLL